MGKGPVSLVWVAVVLGVVLGVLPPTGHAQTGVVPLTLIPTQSGGVWSVDEDNRLNATFQPAAFDISGVILINVTQVSSTARNIPTEVVLLGANLSTIPSNTTITLSSSTLIGTVARLTLNQPQLNLDGGTLDLDSETGNFTVTPENATVGASSVSGQVLGNNVNVPATSINIPPDNLEEANGTLASIGPDYVWTSTVELEIKLSDVAAAVNVNPSFRGLLADDSIKLLLNIQAQGRPPQPPMARKSGPRS